MISNNVMLNVYVIPCIFALTFSVIDGQLLTQKHICVLQLKTHSRLKAVRMPQFPEVTRMGTAMRMRNW